MHWHQLRSHVPQVFQVTSHIVGFRSVLHVVNFDYCRCNHLLNFDLYANSLQRFTLRKRSVEVLSLQNERLGRTKVLYSSQTIQGHIYTGWEVLSAEYDPQP